MKIFTLAHADYEEYSPFFFKAPEGSTEEDFKKLCNELIEPSIDLLIKNKGIFNQSNYTGKGAYVGWREIVESICYLLLEHGYEQIKFYEITMFGPSIIGNSFSDEEIPYEEYCDLEKSPNSFALSKSAYLKVAKYNQTVRKIYE